MRILVTGGAGFIGSHFVAKLLAIGHESAIPIVNRQGGAGSNPPQKSVLEGSRLTMLAGFVLCSSLF